MKILDGFRYGYAWETAIMDCGSGQLCCWLGKAVVLGLFICNPPQYDVFQNGVDCLVSIRIGKEGISLNW